MSLARGWAAGALLLLAWTPVVALGAVFNPPVGTVQEAAAPVAEDLSERIGELEQAGELVAGRDLQALAATGEASAWSFFQRALQKLRSSATRARIYFALGAFWDAKSTSAELQQALRETLEAVLTNKQAAPVEQAAAARALARSGPEAQDLLVKVVLKKGAESVRLAALEAVFESDVLLGSELAGLLQRSTKSRLEGLVPIGERGDRTPQLRARSFVLALERLPEDLVEAGLEDKQPAIRIPALLEWARRGGARAVERAQRTFLDATLSPPERASAGRVWVELGGAEALQAAFDAALAGLGLDKFNPGDEKQTRERQASLDFAEALGEHPELGAAELAASGLARASSVERLFRLEALGETPPKSAESGLKKCLDDPELLVRERAILGLAAAADGPELIALVARTKEEYLAAAALSLASGSYASDAKVAEWLTALPLKDNRGAVRRAALFELAEVGVLPEAAIQRALDSKDFSDQLAAVRALGRARRSESIQLLVQALPGFGQRVLPEAVEVLSQLTGQPFGELPELWARWYEERGQGMVPISAERAEEIRATRESLQDDSRTAAAEFFGIQLRGERIVFLIDVSGSMQTPTSTDRRSATSADLRGASRMEVAKAELAKALQALPEAVEFEILTFDSSVRTFTKGVEKASPKRVAQALKFIEKLRPGSATNLWGGLEKALEIEGLDTLVVLSDGEPSIGSITQPGKIASTFQARNRWRGIRVHTIAFGARLGVLERLARESGGQSRFFP